MYGKPKPKPRPKPRPRAVAAVASLVAAVVIASMAGATGNIKPGFTVHNTFKDSAPCAWDTTISVTSSTLDTLQAHCFVGYIYVASLTASMNIAVQAVGDQNPVRTSTTSTLGSGFKRVGYNLNTYTAATGEYISVAYTSDRPSLYGVIIDGQSTGSVYVRFEPR